jgi:hypothetical protein
MNGSREEKGRKGRKGILLSFKSFLSSPQSILLLPSFLLHSFLLLQILRQVNGVATSHCGSFCSEACRTQ